MPSPCPHKDQWTRGNWPDIPGKVSEDESIALFRKHQEWLSREEGSPPDLSQVSYHGDLSKWNFQKAHLKTADLRGALLISADFFRANLDGANLQEAHLEGAHIYQASLKSASLTGAYLGQATIQQSKLQNAQLSRSDLQGADLNLSDLSGAKLQAANLAKAQLLATKLLSTDFSDANLEGANISGADLEGANLRNANLSGANLADVTGLLLDSTIVRHARFSPRASDHWSILRRNYTGAKLLFHLLFLVMFLSVTGAKLMFWIGINIAQAEIISRQNEINEKLEKIVNKLLSERDGLEKQGGMIVPNPSNLDTKNGLTLDITPCLTDVCIKQSIAAALVRWHEGFWFWSTSIAILGYNFLRGVLTWLMTPLREEEERSGHTPPYGLSQSRTQNRSATYFLSRIRECFEVYGWLIYLHRVSSILFLIAVASLIFHGWHALFQTDVWIPARPR